ncbi:MAG TPA: redoxin domain-containing protein, partial [Planctomycetaceae bacterium]|nr:redoxin domain-containing protein [Planctomycetaceae bacterium]
ADSVGHEFPETRLNIMSLIFGTVLPWLLIAVGTWLGYQFVRQNGRILLRLDSLDQQLRPRSAPKREPSGLPLGSVAPDFELPDLAGINHKLSDYRGQHVLLMFFNPGCGFCTKMLDELATLSVTGSDMLAVPLVVSTGELEANLALVKQHDIRCGFLRQEQMEVASQYQAQGTPMGYRIDPDGRISSDLIVGAEPLLKMIEINVLQPPKEQSKSSKKSASNGKVSHHSLERSRLKRDGLKTGDKAPEFRLPRIDGGEIALEDFRGERVLLVFSDPECAPCDELAPHLQQIHEQRSDIKVLMISRKETELNVAKATRLGLTFPILLQKRWEISLQYAMFATPIGYLIDERGILLRDVAVGVEPILALLEDPIPDDFEHAQPSLVAKEAVSTK